MKLLIFMIFGHLLGDVFLRNVIIDRHKHDNMVVQAFHCFIVTTCIAIPLEVFSKLTMENYMILLLSHFIIDEIKGKLDLNRDWEKDGKPDVSKYKIVDQIVHLIFILIVWGV
ncbi:hypothetical protein LCGC14_1046320 [marine sediment metagenome]|uniref:DUF3307 domain-containing protein n=1 Tax=marine sediment metagenome TaxID=412755 RepID=A0A0F9NBZ1_9ZZZZ